jgi:hypothetical protein
MNKQKAKSTAKAVATGIIIAELAILDYVAVQMTRGIEVSYDLSELEGAEDQAFKDMEGEL